MFPRDLPDTFKEKKIFEKKLKSLRNNKLQFPEDCDFKFFYIRHHINEQINSSRKNNQDQSKTMQERKSEKNVTIKDNKHTNLVNVDIGYPSAKLNELKDLELDCKNKLDVIQSYRNSFNDLIFSNDELDNSC